MAFDILLAQRVREYLELFPELVVEEKRMFGGLAFLVNDKMCVNISGDKLMCRFNPEDTSRVAHKLGYQAMNMRSKDMKGYCYVIAEGYEERIDFEYWLNLCIEFNSIAKSSKK